MSSRHFAFSLTLLLAVVLPLPGGRLSAGGPDASPAPAGQVLFIENAGQWSDAVRFQVWGESGSVWLTEDALWLTQTAGPEVEGFKVEGLEVEGPQVAGPNLQPAAAYHLRLSFPGANPHPTIEPFERLDTRVSYFLGSDPAGWRPDVPVWGGVRYRDLYPGIDLELSAARRGWSWRLVRDRPSAALDPRVTLRVEGADAVTVDGAALRLSTALGDLAVPLLQAGGSRGPATVQRQGPQAFAVVAPFVPASFDRQPAGAGRHVVAGLPAENPADLLYSVFLGGGAWDGGTAIAIDGAGQAYITGHASSAFPTGLGPGYDTTFNGSHDAFVVKLNAVGDGLCYATFLGGRLTDIGYGIAVDGASEVYVTGMTSSVDFPASLGGGYDTSPGGFYDAFVVKLDAAGTGLRYATYLGGGGDDRGHDIALDAAGQAYITGGTASADFPASLGPGFDTTYNGGNDDSYATVGDAFVVKLDAAGAALVYATYLGGSAVDWGNGIAVDAASQAYVTGSTGSADFPAGPGPGYDTRLNGSYDAFVVKLDPAGAALVYATFLGGSEETGGVREVGSDIAVDAAGQAYVTGSANSPDFPAAGGPGFDTNYHGGGNDAFVVKLNAAGAALVYATFLGGSHTDAGYGIAIDRAGQAYVTGQTHSADFPASLGPGHDTSHNGEADAFIVKLDVAGGALRYATFFDYTADTYGNGIAADSAGHAYVVGYAGYVLFSRPYFSAFVIKLDTGAPPPAAVWGAIWQDLDGDAARDASEPGIGGVQVCAEPLGHRPVRCAASGEDGRYEIEVDAAGTYLVAPSAAPAGLQLTTKGFRLPVVVPEGQQAGNVDFGYR